jgi:hypothetical protein
VLRTEPLPKAAAAVAASGNVAGLAVLLARHKTTLAPRLLQLLSALPESLDPRTYASLLPRAAAPPGAAAAAAPPRLGRPVGVGAVAPGAGRKVDWVETEETCSFLAAAAAGSSSSGGILGGTAAAAERSSSSNTLLPAPSIDTEPGLPLDAAAAAAGGGAGSGSPASLRPSGCFDIASYALSADEAAVMVHATEEMERHCCAQGLNKRVPPTDQEVRLGCFA